MVIRVHLLLGIVLTTWSGGFAQRFDLVTDFAAEAELKNTTGVAVADYDQDGDLDVYLVSAEVFDPEDRFTWSRLMRNDGPDGFQDVTEFQEEIRRLQEMTTGAARRDQMSLLPDDKK